MITGMVTKIGSPIFLREVLFTKAKTFTPFFRSWQDMILRRSKNTFLPMFCSQRGKYWLVEIPPGDSQAWMFLCPHCL